MLTGMPISISLGLGAHVPVRDDHGADRIGGTQLFTGIEVRDRVRSSSWPATLTHGGVARRMIKFASSMVGHGPRPRSRRRDGLARCSPRCPDARRHVVAISSIILPAIVKQGFRRQPPASSDLGRARHPDSAFDRDDGDVRSGHKPRSARCSSPASCPGSFSPPCRRHHLVARADIRLPAAAKATWRERWRAFRDSIWDLLLVVW
jgi:C4-dicarboxylate transporter DctM subunit